MNNGWSCGSVSCPQSPFHEKEPKHVLRECVFLKAATHFTNRSTKNANLSKTPARQNHRTSLEDIDSAEVHNGCVNFVTGRQ